MASSNSLQELLRVVAVSVPQSADRLNAQLGALAGLTATQNDRVRENTEALITNTSSRSSTVSQVASTGKTILNALGGGLFLSPLISGLGRLFRGSRNDEVTEVAPAMRPGPLTTEAAYGSNDRSQYRPFDYDQNGQPRLLVPARTELNTPQIGNGSAKDLLSSVPQFFPETTPLRSTADTRQQPESGGFESQGPQAPSAQPNVTIQIHAFDSRSVLDRADDIARALREAMLNSHSVNDVIGEV
jgi:hypothetical protein